MLIPQVIEVIHRQTVVNELFHPGTTPWELVHKESEQAFIKDGYYWMENTSHTDWMYYKYKIPFKRETDWLLDAELELISPSQSSFGHYGLVWGFQEDREYLNKFTVSADGDRCLVMHFQKDHHRIMHRYQKKLTPAPHGQPVQLSILKAQNYYYFLVNRTMVYMCEASCFAHRGPYMGYYVEPGLFIRSPRITLERFITKQAVDNLAKHLYV